MVDNIRWQSCLEKGRISEQAVELFFRKHYPYYCYKSVTNDEGFQMAGIDGLIIKRNTNEYRKLEIKSGIDNNKRIIIEKLDGAREGWLYTTKTNFMIWYNNKFDTYYVLLRFPEFKEWLIHDPGAEKYCYEFINKDDYPKISVCWWVDILRIQKELAPSWIIRIDN